MERFGPGETKTKKNLGKRICSYLTFFLPCEMSVCGQNEVVPLYSSIYVFDWLWFHKEERESGSFSTAYPPKKRRPLACGKRLGVCINLTTQKESHFYLVYGNTTLYSEYFSPAIGTFDRQAKSKCRHFMRGGD